jgi:hypothetical protein
MDVEWWATTLQFVGAVVASLGLLWAWVRAARFREEKLPRIRDQVRKLSYALGRRPPQITGNVQVTLQPLGANLGLEGFPPLVRIRNPTPEERFTALEDAVDRLIRQDIPPVLKDIKDLKSEIAATRSLAKSEADSVLDDVQERIADLRKDLDRTQTLDVRVAIAGLALSAAGTFLQYYVIG